MFPYVRLIIKTNLLDIYTRKRSLQQLLNTHSAVSAVLVLGWSIFENLYEIHRKMFHDLKGKMKP